MRFESVRRTFNEHVIGTVIGRRDAEMLRRGFLEIYRVRGYSHRNNQTTKDMHMIISIL